MFPRPIAAREEGKVYRLVSGPRGRVLALVMDTVDGEIRLLDGLDLSRRGAVFLGALRTARACALNASDTLLVVATDDDVTLFDLASGMPRWSHAVSGEQPAIAFTHDGQSVAVGTSPSGVVLLGVEDGTVRVSTELRDEPRAIVSDRDGLIVGGERTLSRIDTSGGVRERAEICSSDEEVRELVLVDDDLLGVAGTGPGRVWLEFQRRKPLRPLRTLTVDGDGHAEGLAFAGGVVFLATEGGTYRADPPFEQLTRWLPPLGGAHDPTRLAPVADAHIAIAARDVRVFRTRS